VGQRTLDVTLDLLPRIPPECLESCYWELAEDVGPADARFHKEEWFSMALLEWGSCGKVVLDGEDPRAFSEYAPATLYPRVARFPAGDVSDDAVYLAYCYVVEGDRGKGLGTHLVRAVARDLVDRGYRAIEALADREWAGGWILPVSFLGANGFSVVRDDPRFPLMRLDLRATAEPEERVERAALSLPASAPAAGVA
jgi:GNAT superfamily N-acetyltransferase